MPIWVTICDVDLVKLSTKRMLGVMSSMIGKPVCLDGPMARGDQLSFAKMRVEFTLRDSKRKEVVLESFCGKVFKSSVIFEWLPWRCFCYNAFGHSTYFCKSKRVFKGPKSFVPHKEWMPKKVVANHGVKKVKVDLGKNPPKILSALVNGSSQGVVAGSGAVVVVLGDEKLVDLPKISSTFDLLVPPSPILPG